MILMVHGLFKQKHKKNTSNFMLVLVCIISNGAEISKIQIVPLEAERMHEINVEYV